ncbi:MAG: DNA starvation/stationary phase protection protein [Pseudomonadota bacterium]
MTLGTVEKMSANVNSLTANLRKALAETKIETAKAQTFHWNVQGMAFAPLHALFQEIYEDHFEAEDVIAERLKSIGQSANGSLSVTLATSELAESDAELKASEMVAVLADDQRHLSATMASLAKAAEAEDDIVTTDMATQRAQAHDKFAWMLSAHLGE